LPEPLGCAEIEVLAGIQFNIGPAVAAVKPAEISGNSNFLPAAAAGIGEKICIVVINPDL